MKVLVSGSTGFIGSALVPALEGRGHEVVRLVRAEPRLGAVHWDPSAGTIDVESLAGIDACVHLAGEGIGDRRWNAAHKARVLDSRVRGTRLLAEGLASLDPVPRVMVSQSGIHFYGDRGDEKLTEDSPRGEGFMAEVVVQWEQSADPARAAGIRVVHPRTAPVLSLSGGILKLMALPFRFGVGGRLASGRQYMSWISLQDEIEALLHVLQRDSYAGPVNFAAPNPVTNEEFTKTLGRALRRPTLLPVPAAALKIVLGPEMADQLLLSSLRVLPARLEDGGFSFRHRSLESTLHAELEK